MSYRHPPLQPPRGREPLYRCILPNKGGCPRNKLSSSSIQPSFQRQKPGRRRIPRRGPTTLDDDPQSRRRPTKGQLRGEEAETAATRTRMTSRPPSTTTMTKAPANTDDDIDYYNEYGDEEGGLVIHDQDVIVPPPSPTNPIPILSLALKLDNREQFMRAVLFPNRKAGTKGHRLTMNPVSSATADMNNPLSGPPRPRPRRQSVLVFSSSSFRALLLRHVLDDPSSGGGGTKAASSDPSRNQKKNKKKKNSAEAVPAHAFPLLPPHILSTDVLINDVQGTSIDNELWSDVVAQPSGNSITSAKAGYDSVTYVLSASALSGAASTLLLRTLVDDVHRRKQLLAKHQVPFQVWVLPQPNAYLTKVLNNAFMLGLPSSVSGAQNIPHVIIANPTTGLSSSSISEPHCQLDWFPLETDVLSMECESLLREAIVEGVPSRIVQTSARALLKLQDVLGTFPRIQAYGSLAEDVIRTFLNLQVDEHLSHRQQQGGNNTDNSDVSAADDDGKGSAPPTSSLVAALIVMDRRVDCVTPLLTPLTYEGLLDEVFGIEAGHLHVPDHVLRDDDDDTNTKADNKGGPTSASSPPTTADASSQLVALPLHSGDALYGEVRDQHVEQFGTFLQNQARALKESHANFTSTTKKKDLAEIHQFVKQIPVFTQNLKSLTNHIQLAEKIKAATQQASFREQWQLERSILEGESTTLDAIEDLMASQYPVWKLLRLLCLQSVCQGGIKSSRYDSIKRDVVQTYGYKYLLVLSNLEKAGLLSRREGLWVDATVTGSPFYSVRNSLHLIHAEVDTIDPDDIAYVSSGYAPLSVRIIQTSIKGWTNGREDILKENLGGGMPSSQSSSTSGVGAGGGGGGGGGVRFIDILQRRTPGGAPEDLAAALKRKPPGSLGQWAEALGTPSGGSTGRKPTLVVFYLGGVTYMELASLRFLSKRPTFPYHILCVTSKIVNGTTMLRTLSL